MPTNTCQSLTITDWLPPPVLNGSRQRHWSKLRAEANTVRRTVWGSAMQAGWRYVGDDAPRHKLTITFVFPVKRTRDVDNLYARAKHCVDGIKAFLVDDDSEHLELIVRAETRPGVRQTELILEAIPDA